MMNLQVRVLSYCLDSGKKKPSPMADPVTWICRMAVRQGHREGDRGGRFLSPLQAASPGVFLAWEFQSAASSMRRAKPCST